MLVKAHNLGVDSFIIPCNTAHFFKDKFIQNDKGFDSTLHKTAHKLIRIKNMTSMVKLNLLDIRLRRKYCKLREIPAKPLFPVFLKFCNPKYRM